MEKFFEEMTETTEKRTVNEAVRLSLEPMRRRAGELYRRIGDPWRGMKVFHVAGTNGKGAISSYLTHILCSAGHKVGWYTSPYLERFNERIRIFDDPSDLLLYGQDMPVGEIPDETIERLMEPIREAGRAVMSETGVQPSQFDYITALAFSWYAEEECDVVVLETGLGGRLDSTNIVESPLASILSSLGYDHMDRLGNCIEEIMWEKAGIIKDDCPVFAYDPRSSLISKEDADAARGVLERMSRVHRAPLTYLGYDDITVLTYSLDGQTFQFNPTGNVYETKLLGVYHPIYAMLAAEAVRSAGLADETAIREGVACTIWPGRLEVLLRSPLFLLDGAHNWQAGLALEKTVARLTQGTTPVIFLVGTFRDKDYRHMLQAVLQSDRYSIEAFVATEPPSERRLSAFQLKEEAEKLLATSRSRGACVEADPFVERAMERALRLAGEKGAIVCAFGSLYLAGEIKTLMRAHTAKSREARIDDQEDL